MTHKGWVGALLAVFLAGCAVGLDFEPPPALDVSRYTAELLVQKTNSADVKGGEAQRLVQDLDIPGQWWTLFHSEALNAMVEETLKDNPTLPAAEAALRQAWENVYVEEGEFFPTAVVSYSPNRNKTATGIPFTAASSGPPFFTLRTAQVVVTYAPDVFGGVRRQVGSLMATAEFQAYQLEAAYLTLTSNVVAAAVQEASLRGQSLRAKKSSGSKPTRSTSSTSNLPSGRWRDPMSRLSKRPLAQAQATLPPLQKQLAVQRDLLTALIESGTGRKI